jgi:hypothetical protein
MGTSIFTSILRVTAITTVVIFIGLYTLGQFNAGQIENYITSAVSGCGNTGQKCCKGWCVSGLGCSAGYCINSENSSIVIDETYLIKSPDTATVSQMNNDYFLGRDGTGWEDCSNAASCTGCQKNTNFQRAKTCEDCSICDSETGKCDNCLMCASAEEAKFQRTATCHACTGCTDIADAFSPSCTDCSYCEDPMDDPPLESVSSCEGCLQCDSSKCYSCFECGTKGEYGCEAGECQRTAQTTCKTRSEYFVCEPVKDCIMSPKYVDSCLTIEEFALVPLPWESGYKFSDQFSSILSDCQTGPIKLDMGGNVNQLLCDYDNSKINFVTTDQTYSGKNFRPYFMGDENSYIPNWNLPELLSSGSLTGENEGILFNDCGITTVYPAVSAPSGTEVMYESNPTVFNSDTTPRTSEGKIPTNLEISVTNVTYNEQFGNDCSYSVYLCPQEAIADSYDDQILTVYRNFSYFNESDHVVTKANWETYGDLSSTKFKVNVTGIKFPKIKLNISGRTVPSDVAQIAKAAVAGLRDYFIFSGTLNRTLKFFCTQTNLHPDIGTCLMNNTSVVINDKMPWRLEGFVTPFNTLSSIPNAKTIYYNLNNPYYTGYFEAELTFFAYTSTVDLGQNANIENTIFVTPVIVISPAVQSVYGDYKPPESSYGTGSVSAREPNPSFYASSMIATTKRQTLKQGNVTYGTKVGNNFKIFTLNYSTQFWRANLFGDKDTMLYYADQIETIGENELTWAQTGKTTVSGGGEVARCKNGAVMSSQSGASTSAKTKCDNYQTGFDFDLTTDWFDQRIGNSTNMVSDAATIRTFVNSV